MTTLLVTNPHALDHVTSRGHPERADRFVAVMNALAADEFAALRRVDAPRADHAAVALCHPLAFVEALAAAAPEQGLVAIDADTTLSPGSLDAALHGVGGALAAVDAVLERQADNAFVVTRPPGHHAETTRAMGFCLFNNAAIAARHAQVKHGVERVAVVDFDVHHGNGTQDIFWSDDSVMYASTHEMPLYPGTGATGERGDHDTIVNAPLRAGDGGNAFRQAFSALILPRLRAFGPELVVISAGFDAHRRDPLANLQLDEADFAWVTQQLLQVANASAQGRVVSILEGGYDLQGLAHSAAAHVAALMKG